ncbi:cytochrome P450 [Collybia nuda]|uniref:Cytochrome P450 n=1 Tax=Collybia nuda TaxID=64659 RepID=A0A9P6CPK5_9AGAR|nr:cytochrome P450 [Collybia nuda]
MFDRHPLAVVLLVLTVFILGYQRLRNRVPRGTRLPPGPKGLPIVGNVFDMPKENAWLTYANWSVTFGDIVYVEVFGSPLVILNSVKATTELFEKRSANYADRPPMVMVNELMGWEWNLGHMRYSDWWRRHRKMFHHFFQPRSLSNYHEVQLEATSALLHQLLDKPNDFYHHVLQHAAAAILRVIYGYDVKTTHDFYVSLVNEAAKDLTHAVTGLFLVEFLPILKHIPAWFPGASFKRRANLGVISAGKMRDMPFESLKRSIADGTAVSCFVSESLEALKDKENVPENEETVVKNCAGVAYLAGSDTTASVVASFMLAMAHYPDVQSRAQAELKAVVGLSKLPNFTDRPMLPYIDSILSETLRWNPAAPLAVPHRSVEDDVYEGMYIPAGSVIIGNSWAILHDENAYPEPFAFKPERFLGDNEKQLPPDPAIVGAFGFGRRICPGRHFAMDAAWIAIASILTCFKISKAVDENGNVIEPAIEYTDGLAIHPKPFKLQITPRSQEIVDVIRSADESKK